VASPVDIVVTDPAGNVISRFDNQIDLAAYDKTSGDVGATHTHVTIPVALDGRYDIAVVPEPNALSSDTFSITVVRNGVPTVVANEVRIDEIPSVGYQFDVLQAITVGIDIQPGDIIASINRRARGRIPVAILSSPALAAVEEVAADSLTFGRTGYERSFDSCDGNGEDVNADGLADLVCHFTTDVTEFELEDLSGTLRGVTRSGARIEGSDIVRIVR